MWATELKIGRGWRPLSVAVTERHATWQSFGWMIVFKNASWRTGRGDMVATELVNVLRKRQQRLDAPGVLDKCEESGVVVWLEGGDCLKVRGPLTDDLRDDIRRCKPELVKLLAEVTPWDDLEAIDLKKSVASAHDAVKHLLHPLGDDVFTIAGRNVLADILASIVYATAARRIDALRRRCHFAIGWLANLDCTLLDLRTPGAWQKRGPIDLTLFEGVGFTKRK